jgi:hypothetical protein
MRFGSVLKIQSKIRSDPAIFTKRTSKHIQKYSVVCGFRFFWIGLRFLLGLVWIWASLSHGSSGKGSFYHASLITAWLLIIFLVNGSRNLQSNSSWPQPMNKHCFDFLSSLDISSLGNWTNALQPNTLK